MKEQGNMTFPTVQSSSVTESKDIEMGEMLQKITKMSSLKDHQLPQQ
jgi:hypothetical protein